MRVELKRLHQRLGKTFVYVTHDQIEAMTLADRIVLLREGVIEQEGAPLDLFERPRTRFVAGFLGSPSMNFLPAQAEMRDGRCTVHLAEGVALAFPPERSGALAPKLNGGPLTLGIRPEHIGRPDGEADGRRIRATVDLVQPTGTRTYIQFRLGGREVTAELPAHDVETPGAVVDLSVDMARAVLIDDRTELVL
jgi:multiple sugar transport system ATP-binding protein